MSKRKNFLIAILVGSLVVSTVPISRVFAAEFDEQFYSSNDILFYDPRAVNCSEVSSDLMGNGNEEQTWNFFISKGLSEKQVAGMIGNFQVEAPGINPKTNQTGGGPGRGIAQWGVNDRWAALQKWAGSKDIFSLQTQLEFVWYELNGSEKAAFDKFKPTTTIRDATSVFMSKYERPGVEAFAERLAAANLAYGKYSKDTTEAAPVAGPEDAEAPEDIEPSETTDQSTSTANPSCDTAGSGDIVAIAQAELKKGVVEVPIGCDAGNPSRKGDCGAEVNKYTDSTLEYWCADFVSWVYKQAGTPFTGGSSGGWRIPGVSGLRAWFEKNGTYTPNGSSVTPKPGDVYITAGESHTGIVEKVEGGKVYTISGNTSTENYSNGVGVGSTSYPIGSSSIKGYGSLNKSGASL